MTDFTETSTLSATATLRVPEEGAVKVFTPNGSNQSLYEGMR